MTFRDGKALCHLFCDDNVVLDTHLYGLVVLFYNQ